MFFVFLFKVYRSSDLPEASIVVPFFDYNQLYLIGSYLSSVVNQKRNYNGAGIRGRVDVS